MGPRDAYVAEPPFFIDGVPGLIGHSTMVRQKAFLHSCQINVWKFQTFCSVESHQKHSVSLIIFRLIALVEQRCIEEAFERLGTGLSLVAPRRTYQLFNSGESRFAFPGVRITAFDFVDVANPIDQVPHRLN